MCLRLHRVRDASEEVRGRELHVRGPSTIGMSCGRWRKDVEDDARWRCGLGRVRCCGCGGIRQQLVEVLLRQARRRSCHVNRARTKANFAPGITGKKDVVRADCEDPTTSESFSCSRVWLCCRCCAGERFCVFFALAVVLKYGPCGGAQRNIYPSRLDSAPKVKEDCDGVVVAAFPSC
ncbi:hypothetical protein DM02DRAFT_157306 [Periconia macrospinosa]|uniref:Uncharacterized protein n=1 Tax=Periconia macrospinosa TaxID=97972 RepID=A0A2V1EG42_9PLEO|nr:hypothetical protein DM02DRAFT_157306 [Periconia macrospinosa]